MTRPTGTGKGNHPNSRANLKRGPKGRSREEMIELGKLGQQAKKDRAVGMVQPPPDEPQIVTYRRTLQKLLVSVEQEVDRFQRRSPGHLSARDIVELQREARQTSERLHQLIEQEGQAASRDEWFADLETIFERNATKLAKAAGLVALTVPERGDVLATASV